MTPERLNEIMDGLGLSRRELARRMSGATTVDGKSITNWRKGARPVPSRVAEWLEALWAVRHDAEALDVLWAKPPAREGAEPEAPEPPMSADEFAETLEALGLSKRRLLSKLRGYAWGEITDWLHGVEPVDLSVAGWLRRLRAANGDEAATDRVWRRPPPGRLEVMPAAASGDKDLDHIEDQALLLLTEEWASQSSLTGAIGRVSGELRLGPATILAGLARAGVAQSEYQRDPADPARSGLAWKLTAEGVRARQKVIEWQAADQAERETLALEEALADPSDVPGASQKLYAGAMFGMNAWFDAVLPDFPRGQRQELASQALAATYQVGMTEDEWKAAAKRWLRQQMQGAGDG